MVQPQREMPHHPQTSQFSTQLKMFLIQLVQQRPLIFWGGVWAIALVLISGSIASLLDPADSRQISLHELFPPPQPIATPQPIAPTPTASPPASPPAATPIAAQPPAIQAEQPTVPYRSLGAIVLGCGLGSVLIAQLMNRSSHPQRLRSTAPGVKRPPVLEQPKMPTVVPPQPQPTAPTVYQMPPALTMSRSKPQLQRRSTVAEQPATPAVTVLPTEASHALDWDDNSLVNAMDIRKRRSLSSWM